MISSLQCVLHCSHQLDGKGSVAQKNEISTWVWCEMKFKKKKQQAACSPVYKLLCWFSCPNSLLLIPL